MKIDSSFPGGNIAVEKIERDSVFLHQDLRDTEGPWFYWYFRVTGAEGRTVRFHFTQSRALTVRGPACSTDGGASWKWLGRGSVEGNSFVYPFADGEKAALFAMTMPYTGADWNRFVSQLGPALPIEPGILCRSTRGRAVESLRLGCLHGTPDHRVVIVARHHSCETMASYALEGLARFLSTDEPDARWLRERVEFLVVPFVDKDGVEAGDQGKNRRPRDHNRDYDAPNLYPETAALRALIPAWSQGRLRAALDLHCPWIADGMNETLFLVGSSPPAIAEEQRRFSGILERGKSGPLPFLASDYLPFGQDWNVGTNFHEGKSFTAWISELPEVRLAASVEVPYADARGVEVNAETARGFGADLARAFAPYLKTLGKGGLPYPP